MPVVFTVSDLVRVAFELNLFHLVDWIYSHIVIEFDVSAMVPVENAPSLEDLRRGSGFPCFFQKWLLSERNHSSSSFNHTDFTTLSLCDYFRRQFVVSGFSNSRDLLLLLAAVITWWFLGASKQIVAGRQAGNSLLCSWFPLNIESSSLTLDVSFNYRAKVISVLVWPARGTWNSFVNFRMAKILAAVNTIIIIWTPEIMPKSREDPICARKFYYSSGLNTRT